jgi:hypothetical protein
MNKSYLTLFLLLPFAFAAGLRADKPLTPKSQQTLAGAALLLKPIEPFLKAHCYDCHSGADAEAGLDLESLALEQATISDHEFGHRDIET